MKLRFNRKPNGIWRASFIPETSTEKRALLRIYEVGANQVSCTFGGRDRHNPLGFALNFRTWIQPRPPGRYLLVPARKHKSGNGKRSA